MTARALLAAAATAVLGACATADPLDQVRDDTIEAMTFPATTPALQALRSAYVVGAVSVYGASAIRRHSGEQRDADAARMLFRLDQVVRDLHRLRDAALAGRARSFRAALHAIDVAELAELAVAPTYAAARNQVVTIAAAPSPLSIARTAGEALRQVARIELVREGIAADARAHAAELGERPPAAADWERALEVAVYGCTRLIELAPSAAAPRWCR